MRILVVEDDPIKRRHIVDALLQVDGVDPTTIEEVATTSAAKRALRRQQYDLAVIDIALPAVDGADVRRDAGIQLVDDVLSRPDRYRTPTHFVGVTGFRDVYDLSVGRFASWLLTLAYYEPGRSEWLEALKARTRQILQAAAAAGVGPAAEAFSADSCVLTALYHPELTQVLALPLGWDSDTSPDDDTMYWKGQIVTPTVQLQIVATSAARMGMPAAGIAAAKLIYRYRPKLLVMCGIMAGVAGRVKLGDVIVSNVCWDWGNGKWVEETGTPTFLPAPHQVNIDPSIRERLKPIVADPDFLRSAWDEWKGAKPRDVPRLRMGPVASGAAVLSDRSTVDRILGGHRELLGVEMEYYAMCVAAEEITKPRPATLLVKAVVDFADGRKSDEYQEFGAFLSARACSLLLPVLLDAGVTTTRSGRT